jgi:hypothetical protein
MWVNIVCEGSTDFPVLETVIRSAIPKSRPAFRHIQPDFDALRENRPGTPGTGWQGVRRFLKSPSLAVALENCDILVVQVDASIRKLDEIAKHLLNIGEVVLVLDPLRDHVAGWFGETPKDKAVIVLPKENTEAWLVAVHTRRHNVEEIEDPAQELAVKGLIPAGRSDPWKAQATYLELAAPLAGFVKDEKRLRGVPELERFVGELRRIERRRSHGGIVKGG